jgi:uncharacterized protein (TIGR02466 family)
VLRKRLAQDDGNAPWGTMTTPQLLPIFATPIVVLDVADASVLNADLRKVIEQRQSSHPGTQPSHSGGWQSTWDMDRWGGVPAIRLLALGRNLANRFTTDRDGKPVAVTWRASMWANVNKAGHSNEFTSYPGCFWSAVYYVDDGGIAADPSLGGELEFMDPRGPGPAMYAPHLAYAGGLSAGANETVHPQAGRMVMFPAWLLHQVRPYRGQAAHVSVAFTLSL